MRRACVAVCFGSRLLSGVDVGRRESCRCSAREEVSFTFLHLLLRGDSNSVFRKSNCSTSRNRKGENP
jgi:hypothetical protein